MKRVVDLVGNSDRTYRRVDARMEAIKRFARGYGPVVVIAVVLLLVALLIHTTSRTEPVPPQGLAPVSVTA